MEVSFSTAALFPRDTLDAMRLLKKAGFNHVELMPQCLYETGPEFAEEAVNTGIGAGSIHFPLVFFSMLYNPCDRTKEAGINVALENSHRGITRDPEGLLQTVREIGRENLGPMLDVTESREAGIDPVEFLSNVKPVHIHLSDYGDTRKHLPVGKGSLDWEAIIDSLKDKGYEGLLVIEPSYRYFLENALEELKNCLGR